MAVPSMAASLIEHLPDEGDPQWPAEEMIARNVALVTYAGLSRYIGLNRRLTDHCHHDSRR